MKDDRFRKVSDLRIQHMCEYRFRIRQSRNEQATEAVARGSSLHHMASNRRSEETANQWIRAAILILGIAAAILWVLG